ncbi:MAG: hypothetical protein WC602_05165 [archaeon]
MPKSKYPYANYQRIREARKRLGKSDGIFTLKPMRKNERARALKTLSGSAVGFDFNKKALPKYTSLTPEKSERIISRIEMTLGKRGANPGAHYDRGMRLVRSAILSEAKFPAAKGRIASEMIPKNYSPKNHAAHLESVLNYVKKFGARDSLGDFRKLLRIARTQRILCQSGMRRQKYGDALVNPAIYVEVFFRELLDLAEKPDKELKTMRAQHANLMVALESGKSKGDSDGNNKTQLEIYKLRAEIAEAFIEKKGA